MEKGNYAELDPALMPAWPSSKQNSPPNSSYSRKNTKDWLNQDSIESLKQASGGYSMAPNYTRRVEPARLSMPRNVNGGAMTQRGRNGKLADSQYSNININQQSSPTHGKLLGQKNQLRQTMSVYKVNNEPSQDDFKDEIYGHNCIQSTHNSPDSPNNMRPALFTQGSPLGHLPRQNRFVGQRVNIRTQGGDKPNNGQKASEPSYMNTNAESTVFSSL